MEKFDWEAYQDEAERATYDPADNKLRIYTEFVPRELYDAFKALGFGRAPRQGCFFQVWTPAREDVALALCGEIEDEDSTLFDRAEDRSTRFAVYSGNAESRAQKAIDAGNAALDGIPFGQPILVGHHSEHKHRKAVERAQREADKVVEEVDHRDYWAYRARAVKRHAERTFDRGVVMRRIKKLESELRKRRKEQKEAQQFLDMWLKDGLTPERAKAIANYESVSVCFTLDKYPRDHDTYEGSMGIWSALDRNIINAEQARDLCVPAHRRTIEYAERWTEHLEGQASYWIALLEDEHGVDIDDQWPLKKGVWICCAYGWAQVERVNKGVDKRISSVSVNPETATWYKPGGWFYPRKVTYDTLKEWKSDEEYQAMTYAAKNAAEIKRLERQAAAAKKRREDEAADALRQEAEARKEAIGAMEIKVNWNPDYFSTPLDVVEMMLNEAAPALGNFKAMLEPSVGDGRIIERAVYRWPNLFPAWYEIDTTAQQVLKDRNMGGMQAGTDFLEAEPEPIFDAVVMNPPFGNRAYVKHVMHAYKFLKPEGILVTILPSEARYHIDGDNDKFRTWVKDKLYDTIDLGFGTFKESGTNISTHILVLQKPKCGQLSMF